MAFQSEQGSKGSIAAEVVHVMIEHEHVLPLAMFHDHAACTPAK